MKENILFSKEKKWSRTRKDKWKKVEKKTNNRKAQGNVMKVQLFYDKKLVIKQNPMKLYAA